MENEFGTHKEEEVVQQILEKGTVQETEVRFPFFFFKKKERNPIISLSLLLVGVSPR